LKYRANGLDGALIQLAAFRESCPVVPEGGVNDGVSRSGSAAQAFQVFQIAAMHLSPGSGQRLGARIAARKTEHLVACADEFRDNPRTDEPCCTCYETRIGKLLFLSIRTLTVAGLVNAE
jgi:hypothetical protein